MLTDYEKKEMIQSNINQLEYNIRDNLVQIEEILVLEPEDSETINAIERHIEDNRSKINTLQNALNELNIASS